MNHKLLLIIASLLILRFESYSEDSNSSESNNKDTQINPGGRPKAPSKNKFDCNIHSEFLTIIFKNPVGNAEIEILNLESGEVYHYSFDSSIPFTCFVGNSSIGYQLKIFTDQGTYIQNL